MKKLVFLLMLAIFFIGCGHKQIIIREEAEPRMTSRPEPLVIPPNIFRSDPTLGKIKNNTRNIWIKVWVDPEVKNVDIEQYDQLSVILGDPFLIFIPGLVHELHMDLGIHLVYAEGMIQTKYGLKSLGFATKDVVVDSRISGGGHYGWYVSFSQGDFQR